LQSIIQTSEERLALDDLPIEVEYQGATIGKYDLEFDGEKFLLISTQTDCLAQDKCLVTPAVETAQTQCAQGSGCC
jgi:hypothetical protein